MRYYHPPGSKFKATDIGKHQMGTLMNSGEASEMGPEGLKTPISGTPSITPNPVSPSTKSSSAKSGITKAGRDAKGPSRGTKVGSAR